MKPAKKEISSPRMVLLRFSSSRTRTSSETAITPSRAACEAVVSHRKNGETKLEQTAHDYTLPAACKVYNAKLSEILYMCFMSGLVGLRNLEKCRN